MSILSVVAFPSMNASAPPDVYDEISLPRPSKPAVTVGSPFSARGRALSETFAVISPLPWILRGFFASEVFVSLSPFSGRVVRCRACNSIAFVWRFYRDWAVSLWGLVSGILPFPDYSSAVASTRSHGEATFRDTEPVPALFSSRSLR